MLFSLAHSSGAVELCRTHAEDPPAWIPALGHVLDARRPNCSRMCICHPVTVVEQALTQAGVMELWDLWYYDRGALADRLDAMETTTEGGLYAAAAAALRMCEDCCRWAVDCACEGVCDDDQ